MPTEPPASVRPKSQSGIVQLEHVWILALIIGFVAIMIRTSWISDDAMITLRQVVNWNAGQGLTWDGTHRIQAFTHPTWFFLLAILHGITGELFYTTISASILLAVVSLILPLHFGVKHQRTGAALGIFGALSFSSSFIDYTSSGLENSLSLFLLGLIVIKTLTVQSLGDPSPVKTLGIFWSLLLLNRLDFLLVIGPLALMTTIRFCTVRDWRRFVPGALIFIAWFVFALIYFGVFFPNTYYAKLNTGYPTSEYLARGFDYFQVSLTRDSVGGLILFAGLSLGLLGTWITRCLSLGILLYCAYILKMGGDFMAGRFLTVPIYLSAINLLLVSAERNTPRFNGLYAALGVLVLIAISTGEKTTLSGSNYHNGQRVKGIADERGFYYQKFGMLSKRRQWPKPKPAPVLTPQSPTRTLCGQLGHTALGITESVRLIDTCGLTDGFLSKLPAIHSPYWRTGHPERKIPSGYIAALAGQRPAPNDTSIQTLYRDAQLLTTGELFSTERFAAMYRMNVSKPYPVDIDLYQNPRRPLSKREVKTYRYTSISRTPLPNGTPYRRRGNLYFSRFLKIRFDEKTPAQHLDLSLDSNDAYELLVNQNQAYRIEKSQSLAPRGGLVRHRIELPQVTALNELLIITLAGDGRCALGHLQVH